MFIGTEICVQNEVETPYFYLLARCPSNEQQLLYSETRMDDIKQLSEPLKFQEVAIKDCMRFFKGDAPAAQFEAGQQKGGEHFCWCCEMSLSRCRDLVHILNLPYTSPMERYAKVKATLRSKKLCSGKVLHPFSDLKTHELVEELHERNVNFRYI